MTFLFNIVEGARAKKKERKRGRKIEAETGTEMGGRERARREERGDRDRRGGKERYFICRKS